MSRAGPVVVERVLLANQEFRAFAIPIVIADQAAGGESTDAFQAIEIVVMPNVPHPSSTRVAAHGKISPQPGESTFERIVFLLRLTTPDDTFLYLRVGTINSAGANHRGADAGTGHAAQPVGPAGLIAPRPVGVLAILPILGGAAPRGLIDSRAGTLRFMQRKHGELRVAIVTPCPRIGPQAIGQLIRFQPTHVALDENLIAKRFRRAKCHRLQRHAVGLRWLNVAQKDKCLLDVRIARRDARIQQRQSA